MPEHKLSKDFKDKLRYFMQDHSPERISKNLRVIFFDYLKMQTVGLPTDFDEIISDVEALFDLMEAFKDEKSSFKH